MAAERRIERHQLSYYLRVFNRITDKPMGYIGNISRDSLMLISPWPMLVYGRFDMRLKILRGDHGRLAFIDFAAVCRWTCEDVTPGSFDSGFDLLERPADYFRLIDALRGYFAFPAQTAST